MRVSWLLSASGIANWARFVILPEISLVYLNQFDQAFIECIQTEEYMHVYNAIIVLKEILPVFPLVVVQPCGTDIDKAIDQLLEREQRGDLKILGKAYVNSSLDLYMPLNFSI